MIGSAGQAVRPLVGLVGLGRMGSAMARALANAGMPLVLANRTWSRCESLADELGCRAEASPAAVAATADVTLTMLADDRAVEDVYGGERGLLAGARRGAVLVDLSTVTPGLLRRFEAPARDAGVGLLDAPVSGSTATAASGTLTLMVGGEAGDLERARPALEPLAASIYHVGALGTGGAMKLAVNTVIFGLNGAVAEGLVLAEAAGIDRALAYEVLATSAVGAPYLGYKRASFLDPAGTPPAFSLALAEKDLTLIAALARELGVPVEQADLNLALVRAASTAGRAELDFSTVAEELRARTAQPVAAGDRPATEEGRIH